MPTDTAHIDVPIDPAHLDAIELPTTDEEIWRYSRIADLDLAAFRSTPHDVEVRGGEGVVTTDTGDDGLGAGVGSGVDTAPDVFAELNTALNREVERPLRITVPAGRVVAEPIVVTHSVPGEGALTAPRLVVDAGADSEVTVIERFRSSSGGTALTLPMLQIKVGPAARVRYLAVNELGTEVWSIAHQLADADRDATLLLSTVALGGDYTRVRTEVRNTGQGSSTRQVALYFADGDQMHDFRVIQDHVGPHTNSDLLFKGAVQDHAASVYTGLIAIGEEARGTAAYQTNRTLTLSEGAWAESVPNLDIRTNDVKCSHASTVGPIDEDQRFYLESRGVQPEVAERLVVLGFFDEVITQLPSSALAEELRERVAAKLRIGESA